MNVNELTLYVVHGTDRWQTDGPRVKPWSQRRTGPTQLNSTGSWVELSFKEWSYRVGRWVESGRTLWSGLITHNAGGLHNKVIRTWIMADTCTEWHVAPSLLQIGTYPVVALCICLYAGISRKAVHRTTNWQRYETPRALDWCCETESDVWRKATALRWGCNNAEWTISLCSASSGL